MTEPQIQDDEDLRNMEAFQRGLESTIVTQQQTDDLNFVEITKIPKNTEARALTSMIVSIAKIVPKSTEICFKGEDLEKVGLVEFKSSVDAHRAVDKLRSSQIVKRWRLKLMGNPKFNDPEEEMINRWLR